MFAVAGGAWCGWAGLTTFGGTTGPSNKELKLTKPSILELRSLTLCSADGDAEAGRDWTRSRWHFVPGGPLRMHGSGGRSALPDRHRLGHSVSSRDASHQRAARQRVERWR